MFSATHTVEVAKWCRKNLHNLVSITIGHRFGSSFASHDHSAFVVVILNLFVDQKYNSGQRRAKANLRRQRRGEINRHARSNL